MPINEEIVHGSRDMQSMPSALPHQTVSYCLQGSACSTARIETSCPSRRHHYEISKQRSSLRQVAETHTFTCNRQNAACRLLCSVGEDGGSVSTVEWCLGQASMIYQVLLHSGSPVTEALLANADEC